MKVALSVHNEIIAPVFDSSNNIEIIEIDNSKINSRKVYKIDLADIFSFFLRNSVDLIICGAISKQLEFQLSALSKVIPFICGSKEEIISALLKNKNFSDFLMPGCKRNRFRSDFLKNYISKGVTKMPRGDGTGPLGQGPMTGRGLGYCSDNTLPGFAAAGYRIGRGFFGRGRRFFCRGLGWVGLPIYSAYNNPQA
ncbi:MAG: hypothetical protein C0174_00595, partial [Thermodesulfobium narugense]